MTRPLVRRWPAGVLALALGLAAGFANPAGADSRKNQRPVTKPKVTKPARARPGTVVPVSRGRGNSSNRSHARSEDAHLIHELRHAYGVLDAANPVYHGHRGKALKEINHAIGHLDREMHSRGHTMHHHKHPDVPANVSHADVRKSTHQVQRVLLELSGMKKTKHRTSAAHHLTNAVHHLGQALHVHR